MNIDAASRALRAAEPIPEGIFPRAKWMREAGEACASLAKQYRQEAAALIAKIQYEGLTSDTYEVCEVRRPYARVNMGLLERLEPEVFAKAVHVRQSFAEATIGRRRLYELVSETLGDGIKEHEVVTVRDVMRMLPRSEAERYIEEGDEFVRYEVQER